MIKFKRILAIILILLALIFALSNFKDAEVNLIIKKVEMPLVLLIIGNLAVGILFGMVLGSQFQKNKRAKLDARQAAQAAQANVTQAP